MSGKIEMIDRKFGRLIVKQAAASMQGRAAWLCLCDCGNFKTVRGKDLRSGNTKSCGCLARENSTSLHTLHGMHGTPAYRSWQGMITRCNNRKQKAYKNYGGRGIKVSFRWRTFQNFYNDMGNRPNGLTIERVDNNKGYSKKNCVWASRATQSKNKRISKNNKSGFNGVFWDKKIKKYRVTIGTNNKYYYLGIFKTIEQATRARKQAELKYWGKET